MTEERVLRLNLPEKASHIRIILHFKDAQGVIIDKCVGVVLREDLELAPPKDILDENKRLKAVLKEIEARMLFCETKCGIPLDSIMQMAGLEHLSEEKKEVS